MNDFKENSIDNSNLFTKNQFLNSKTFGKHKDIIDNVLLNYECISKSELQIRIDDFLNKF